MKKNIIGLNDNDWILSQKKTGGGVLSLALCQSMSCRELGNDSVAGALLNMEWQTQTASLLFVKCGAGPRRLTSAVATRQTGSRRAPVLWARAWTLLLASVVGS